MCFVNILCCLHLDKWVSPQASGTLRSCGFVLISALALPSQDLGGSSGIGNVSALAFLQKNGLIYWIVLSVLCSTFQRGTLAHPSWAPRTHRADYF